MFLVLEFGTKERGSRSENHVLSIRAIPGEGWFRVSRCDRGVCVQLQGRWRHEADEVHGGTHETRNGALLRLLLAQ